MTSVARLIHLADEYNISMCFIYFLKIYLLFGCAKFWSWHVRPSVFIAVYGILVVACEILFPGQGSTPAPLNWERGVLATGLPMKSLCGFILKASQLLS